MKAHKIRQLKINLVDSDLDRFNKEREEFRVFYNLDKLTQEDYIMIISSELNTQIHQKQREIKK